MKDGAKLIAPTDDVTAPEAATGAKSTALREGIAALVAEAVPHTLGLYHGRDVAMAAMAEFAPRNGAEGLLVAQLVAIEMDVLDALRRAREYGISPEHRDMSIRQADRLSSMGLRLREALARGRGLVPGPVSVNNRVNVEAGGQAVVAIQPPLPNGIGADGAAAQSTEPQPREKSPPPDERLKRSPPDRE